MATTDNSMEYTERLRSILLIEKSLSADMRLKVEARAMAMIEALTDDAGNFLHNLDADEHTEDEVKTLINAFPSALSHIHDYNENDEEYDDEMLPIQAAACWNPHGRNAISFVPLLAEEGMKRNIGGERQRGGLLVEDNNECNVVENLAVRAAYFDSMYLDVFKRLRKSGLFRKEDIRRYKLLHLACAPRAKERFEYLVDWNPKNLKEHLYEGEPLLHHNSDDIDNFAMALKAGMKYYPEDLGLLFIKNIVAGKTACELVLDKHGKEEVWGVIEKCFEETHDPKIVERNPMKNLYPFMLAAAGKTSELNTLYYLLCRNPIVLECVGEMDGLDSPVERKRRHVS